MFELKGIEYSRQQLIDAANKYNGGDFDGYLEDMKKKGLVEKQAGSTVDPTMSQDGMGSQSVDGSSESQDENVGWFDQTWFGRGIAAASTTGEATDLMAQDFSNIDMESIQEFMEAKESEAKTHVPSERMTKFQKQYVKEGKTWSAFFRGVSKQPGLLPELFVQSLGTQVGTLIDSPGASLSAAGAGAAVGAGFGAVPGAVAGFMGGLATSMEAALTFGELIETELKEEGKEFTDENIKALLEGPKGNSIRNKSIGRGLTIGAIEGLSGGLAGKAAVATRKAAATVKGAKTAAVAAGAAGVAVEGVGGGVGEVLGRAVAGQEMDAAEIGFEAITGTTTAPINILTALKSAKQPTYELNGKNVTYKEMKDFVETADDIDVAKAKIKIDDDFTGVGKLAAEKQNKAIVDSQIDDKITDKKDREDLVDLDAERRTAEANVKKKGIDKVPNAPEELATIQAEVDAIIGKYEGAMGIGETQKAQDVAKVVRQNRISDTIAFAEAQGKRIGKDVLVVDDNTGAQQAHDKIIAEYNAKQTDPKKMLKAQDVTEADGFIVGDSIVINKDVAGRTEAINVGGHEVLHGILAKHMQSLDIAGKKDLISSFKNVLSKKQLAAVTTRLQDNYKDQIAADPDFMDTTDEWFTAFSDAIEQNEIAFDEGVFGKLKNTIQEILRKFGIKKDFANGRQAYNFLKDYSQSIKKNKLSSRAMTLAGGGVTATSTSKSVSTPLEAINELIPKNIKTKKEFDEFVQDRRLFPPVFMATMDNGVISNYVKSKSIGDEYRGAIESVQNRLTNFDPEATRADGSVVGPEGFGEFVFANTRFGKLDAKKKLFEAGEKAKKTTTIDTKEAKELVDTSTAEVEDNSKARNLRDFDIEIEDGLVNAVILAEIESLLEKNPVDIEVQMEKLILGVIRKQLDDVVGKIAKSEKTGKREPTAEYEAFIRNEYLEIVQSLGMETIRTAYRPWFEKVKVRTEKYKGISPKTDKVTNYVKDVFENKTNKREYIRWFLEGKPGVLTERRTALLRRIARRKAKIATDNYIEANSKNLDKVAEAKLRMLSRAIEDVQVEKKSFDSVKFSQSLTQEFGFLFRQLEQRKKNSKGKLTGKWYYKNEKDAPIVDGEPRTFPNRGIIYEQAFANYFMKMAKKLKMKGFEVQSKVASEKGGMADFIMSFFGEVENHEIKASLTAFMGSVSISNFSNGKIKFATDVHNEMLSDPKFDIAKFEKGFKKRIDFINKGIEKLNLKRSDKPYALLDYDVVSGKPQYIPKALYNDKGFGNKVFYELASDASVITRHYQGKGVNSISFVDTKYGEMSFRLNDDSLLALDMLDAETVTNFTFRNGGTKTVNGDKMIALSLGVQFKITKLNNDVKNAMDITELADFEKATKRFAKLSKSPKNTQILNNAINFSRSANNPTKGITVLDFDDTLATTKSGVRANIPNPDGTPKPGRKVIFLAGGAGSGKGNVISKLGLEDQGFKIVNSDISLEWLKKNSGLPENMNDFTKEQRSKLGSLQHQARGIAKRKMMKYQGEGGGVVVDGTGGSIKSMEKLVNEFKDKGYDVSMMFVETSLPVALERNAARKERSLLDKIVERNHESVQGNKDGFKNMFGDRFMEVNTDNLSQQDVMPTKLTDKMNDFVSGYENRRLDAEEFASEGANILEQGGTFDFSEFNKVVEGQTAPLFEKAMKLQEKFGNKDMFVLTARPAESAQAIFDFLQANGLNIPLENITGLANSTAEAKALWMAEKVGEGYNDFYFADDAIQNVKAVDNMLEQFDVKRKVQQAKADFVKGDPQVVKLLEESSINDVKSVDGLTNPGTYNNIKFSKSHRAEYENTIAKHRPDLVKDKLVSKTVDSMFDYVDGLDVPADKKRKYEKVTTKWLATSNVKLGEDSYKIQQAVELAEKHKEDIFSYRNPNEIIEKYAGKSKAKPTNPKNVKEFRFSGSNNDKGISTYEVEDTKEGQEAVRKVVDTHWGPKSNPWCIIARSEKPIVEPRQYGYESVATKSEAQARKQQLESEGFTVEIRAHKKDYRGIYPGKSIDGKRVDMRYELDIKEVKEGPGIMEDAWQNWTVYNKSPKRIIFHNGRLSSFYADHQYWDRMDSPTDAPVVQIKEGNVTRKVELVPYNEGGVTKIEEFVRETRTVSKDKKTVTTEILAETQNGYAEGTKIVENRVNGITVKSTRTDANGNVSEIINFDKKGKATSNITFSPSGKTTAINRYGVPFGEMSKNDIIMTKGDLLSHQGRNLEGFNYFHGEVKINNLVTEIGWKTPEKMGDLRDFVTTSPNGEIRADLKKILEVDPDAKGLPKGNIQFSKSMDQNFNDILENVTGIDSEKRFSAIKGRKRGESKGKFRFFIPPSHEDFVGLLYNFMGKGKEGNAHRDFFEKALVRPLNRANREFDTARQSVANDYKELNKQFSEVKDKLAKKTPDGDFTFQDAIRVYLWDKHGHKIPGLTETDQAKLVELVQSDPQLQAYAETLNVISKQETYVNPTEGWNSGDIRMDLDDATGRVGRKQFFAEFIENTDIIFSEKNLNKIEAGYGKSVRESLEDMLYRIKTGRNRPSGSNEQVNKLMNFLNGSVGTVMFFNMRSALLQQMSIVNYINFADNNVFAAAKAFANQKQYWADFAFIFNSDMLKQRRGGIQTDVNGAELAASLRKSKNPSRVLISKLLELGFLPTQIGDNIAIATGGASYYRNRINTYLKQGLSQKEAEAKAFTDFQDITQSTQQSARPDMVSKQQASVIGKVILNFQNVTSQFNRLGKKAFQDIYNRRITKPNTTQMQSDISNASRITYYFAIQNMIFYTLQTALFAMMFDDDEEDVNNLFLKKRERLINGSIDSVLRGTGLIGGVVATLKNVAIAFARQRDVNYNPDESAVVVEALNLSPVIGIKARQIVNAEKTLNYNKKVIDEMETFDIDNPQWSAVTNYVQTFTNLPVNRLYNKTQNVRQALNNDHSAWERSLMFLGWSQYNLDLENKKMEEIKAKTKNKKKTNTRSRTRTRTRSRTRTR